MYIVGGLDDQTPLLVWSKIAGKAFLNRYNLVSCYKDILGGLLDFSSAHRPIMTPFFSIFLSLFGSNSYNLFIILTILANLLVSFLFFKRFKFGWVYSFIFAFSAFFWSHLGIHAFLMQLWLIPFFMLFLKKGAVKLGIVMAIIFLISNYYGFFVLLFFSIYSLIRFLLEREGLAVLKHFVVTMFTAGFIAGILLLPFFLKSSTSGGLVVRSFEDFISFSSRPWYFVLPPLKNPWLGSTTEKLLQKISATKYFLADDYFAVEHSGNYFGLLFSAATLLFGVYTLFKADSAVKKKVVLFLGSAFILSLFMLPPFFTLSGVKFWTPGFLLYRFLPMFRVFARLSIVVLFCLLISLGYCFDFVYNTVSKKVRLVLSFAFSIIFVVTLLETYIPPKIQKVESAPLVYSYLGGKEGISFAVYPYSATDEAYFWLDEHKGCVINLYNRELTESLLTKIPANLDFLVVHKYTENLEVFVNSPKLELEQEFPTVLLFAVL